MKTHLRQGFGGQRKINRPFYLFWPDNSLLSIDICQGFARNNFKINKLKNEKTSLSVQNAGNGVFGEIISRKTMKTAFVKLWRSKKGGFRKGKGKVINFLRSVFHGIPGQASDASTNSATSAARNDGFFGRLMLNNHLSPALPPSLCALALLTSYFSPLTLHTVD